MARFIGRRAFRCVACVRFGGASVRRRPLRPGARERGARTKRRSPGSRIVLPRGGIESSPRLMTAMIALRGRPTSRTAAPAIAWSAATTKSMRSSLAERPTSIGASRTRRRRREESEAAGDPFERRSLQDRRDDDDEEDGVEIVFASARRMRERRSRARSGLLRAARPSRAAAARGGEVVEGRGDPDGSRPDHDHEQQREREPGHRNVRQFDLGTRAGRAR